MRKDIDKRLSEIEAKGTDWLSQLKFVDYDSLEDYTSNEWEELHYERPIAVVRNRESGEVRGFYSDRRTDAEIVAAGGNLAYL